MQKKEQQVTAKKPKLEWLLQEYQNNYYETDLIYDPYCTSLFARLEAAKREEFPKETLRIWFMEFIRRGWTRKTVKERYEALISTKIFGIQKLEIADWINALPVFTQDEVNQMVQRRVDYLIQRGNFLKDKDYILTEDDKKAIELAVANECEIKYKSGFYEARENYAQERRRLFEEKFKKG
jgi:hypothetical protein